MHRLPNPYAVTRFRCAALLLMCKWALVIVSAIMLAYSLCVANPELIKLSISLIWLAVCVGLIIRLFSHRVRCPLCIGLPLVGGACSTHRSVRPLFGSYPLRVALSAVFRGWFRCPYCGESTAIEARRDRSRAAGT